VPGNNHVILLVDDDQHELELTITAFHMIDPAMPVVTVEGGEAAIAFLQACLQRHPEHPFPAVVLLDWKMPGMGGRDVLAWIRQRPELNHVRVVVFSTSREPRDVEIAYELGASAYVKKPSEFNDLLSLARVLDRFWRHLNTLPSGPTES